MKTVKALPCLLLFQVLTSGCGQWPTSPSGDSDVRNTWSPYIGVHLFANGETQKPYIEEMVRAGVLQGVRVDGPLSAYSYFSSWASGQGLETLGIFPNELLASSDAPDLFISYVRSAPQIKHWEIGNEVGLFIYMRPEEYTPIFLEIYRRAKPLFPDVEIIPNAPVGGADGPQYLGRMLDLGVEGLLHDSDENYRLRIIAMHSYSITSSYVYKEKNQIERIPANVEVWVTETGVNSQALHVKHVQTVYPRLRNLNRATRIYFYELEDCTGFSLVYGIADSCSGDGIKYSPLYTQLIGGN